MTVYWKPHRDHACEDGKSRTVYVRGEFAPFFGWMATPDTIWSCPAYVRIKGKRCAGYVCSESGQFRPFNRTAHMMPGIPPRAL